MSAAGMSQLLIPALVALTPADLRGTGSPAERSATPEAVVLLELFTSEGCSSCPPADALLADLAVAGDAGTRTVALSEHVDYWDDLGWRDPFSSSVFTQRQQTYARRLGSSVYTPQLVVSGRAEVLGSDRGAAIAAIRAVAGEQPVHVAVGIARGAEGRLSITAEAKWRDGVDADVFVALVQDRASTRVVGGENAGRTLDHVSVVRSLSVIGSGVGTFSGRATIERPAATGHGVVFVQERGGGPVLGAAIIKLP